MANRQLKREQMVLTSKQPQWLDRAIPDRLCDESLYKIILFFVLFSPCKNYCTQGRTLQFYNWKEKPWTTNKYLKDKLDSGVFADKKKYFRSASKIEDLVEEVREAELEEEFYLNREIERVAFFNSEKNAYMSLFYHIRCALAHGRIAMYEDDDTKDVWYVMENGIGKDSEFQVRARMVLRRSTLLRWIDIITAGPQEPEEIYGS